MIEDNQKKRQEQFSGTKPVQNHLKLDHKKLALWLSSSIKENVNIKTVEEFKGGQSNPTYKVKTENRTYVLRKKPPGKLLPSAHAVDREYTVIDALYRNEFPVPRPIAYCGDSTVLGTEFYLMDFVDGEIFWNISLPELNPETRRLIFDAKVSTLAKLQTIDYQKAGLGTFGKTKDYMARQIHRWTKIYKASETSKIVSMDKLIEWLPNNIPQNEETCIIHGDYRLDNMVFRAKSPEVVAVLDWELSTLGDPLGDFVYHLAPWFSPDVGERVPSLRNIDFSSAGIPTEDEYISKYCELTNRKSIDQISFYKAYTLWRVAAIYQGILKRVEDGTAASSDANTNIEIIIDFANSAWKIIKE
ncbi:MAG: phosphotransferase family protein [Pseudomonadota bacterium]|nr:phosphotransferase family protein [Pseudomonadota bacterium]